MLSFDSLYVSFFSVQCNSVMFVFFVSSFDFEYGKDTVYKVKATNHWDT